jgi:hypothetical protein
MKRIKDAFFAPADPRDLNLFRFLYCAALAATLLLDPIHGLARELLARHPELFHPIRLFAPLGIGPMSPAGFDALRWATVAALLCAAAGLATRWSLTASAAAFFLYFGTIYSLLKPPLTDKVGHKNDSVIFVLAILALAPEVGRWGADAWLRKRERPAKPTTAWPLQTIKLLLVLCYLGALYCKLDRSLLWGDGRTLRAYMLESAMASDNAWALALARSLPLCAALGAAVMVFEAGFGAVLFFPRLAWLLVPGGLLMHAAMQVTMAKPYFKYFVLPFLAFVRWPGGKAARNGAARVEKPAALLIAALVAVNAAFILAGAEAWPFSSWRFFCDAKDVPQAVAYRLSGIEPDGKVRWLTASESRSAYFINDYAMRQVVRTGDYAWVEERLAAFREKLPELRRIEIVKRAARERPDGGFDFVDAPFEHAPPKPCAGGDCE